MPAMPRKRRRVTPARRPSKPALPVVVARGREWPTFAVRVVAEFVGVRDVARCMQRVCRAWSVVGRAFIDAKPERVLERLTLTYAWRQRCLVRLEIDHGATLERLRAEFVAAKENAELELQVVERALGQHSRDLECARMERRLATVELAEEADAARWTAYVAAYEARPLTRYAPDFSEAETRALNAYLHLTGDELRTILRLAYTHAMVADVDTKTGVVERFRIEGDDEATYMAIQPAVAFVRHAMPTVTARCWKEHSSRSVEAHHAGAYGLVPNAIASALRGLPVLNFVPRQQGPLWEFCIALRRTMHASASANLAILRDITKQPIPAAKIQQVQSLLLGAPLPL